MRVSSSSLLLLVLSALLVPGFLTAQESEEVVDVMSVRTQKCLAQFDDEKILLEIEYRGNLVTGRQLSILHVDARVASEQDQGAGAGGLLDVGLFSPSDKYAPRNFFTRVRGLFNVPFARRLSDKYSGKFIKAETLLTGDDLHLETPQQELPGRVAIEGYEGLVYLPAAYVRETNQGTWTGTIGKDADNDRIVNLFDAHPFFFDDPEEKKEEELQEKTEEQVQEKVEEQVQDQVEDQVKDQAQDRVDDRLRQRTEDSLRDGRTRLQRVDVDVPKPDRLGNVQGHAARRGFNLGRFFAKPWIAIPALAVVYVGLDKTVLEDKDEVRRVGVLVDN